MTAGKSVSSVENLPHRPSSGRYRDGVRASSVTIGVKTPGHVYLAVAIRTCFCQPLTETYELDTRNFSTELPKHIPGVLLTI